MSPDVAIGFFNAVVKIGSSDRNCTLPAAQSDVPLGIMLNDAVSTGDIGSVRKNVALFGVYPETLPGVATAPIAAGAELIADLSVPGNVKQLPTTAGGGTSTCLAAQGSPCSARGTRSRSCIACLAP